MRTLFSGGTLFDGTGAVPGKADVVVEEGRIVEVGLGLDGDQSVDVSGMSILPGLFDCHVHVMLSRINFFQMLQTPFSYVFYEAARNLEATLATGITTVRDAAGADLGVKQAVQDGLINGPRMQISITGLSQTGGHGDHWMPCGVQLALFNNPSVPSGIVDGPEEMRKKVREIVRAGADVIKVCTTGGVISPRDNPRHAHFRDDELKVLVEEASAAGLWVMSHAQGTEGIKSAIRAGIRSIEHGIYLDDEAIEMMLEKGTYLVPTLLAPQGLLDAVASGEAQVSDASVRKAEEVIEVDRESFRRAVEAGVKVAMGTDSAVTPHGENLRELELMVKGGMSPSGALVATTSTAAELMGLQEELGTVEQGKRADLVIVSGDALEISTIRERIQAVYKDGRLAFGGV